MLPWLRAAPPTQWPHNYVREVGVAIACVGGSEQAIASFSRLHEPTPCDQSCCMPLESDASAELGEAEITVPAGAESFGSPQAVGLAQMIARHTGTVLSTANASHQAGRHTGITLQPTPTQYTQQH